MKILIAGFGNLLRRDDGFGVCLLRLLQRNSMDSVDDVQLLEVGIGGIAVVQELLSAYDALIVLDAIEGERPGDVELKHVTPSQHVAGKGAEHACPDYAFNDQFADIHYAEPGRAIALAHRIGVLPGRVFIVGCVAESTEPGYELSECVAKALEPASDLVRQLTTSLCQQRGSREEFRRNSAEN